MFGWSMKGCLRKYITLWGYFWFFECKCPKTSKNCHILRIFLSNKQSKMGKNNVPYREICHLKSHL